MKYQIETMARAEAALASCFEGIKNLTNYMTVDAGSEVRLELLTELGHTMNRLADFLESNSSE